MQKNNHDLELITCLCDHCYDSVTENEVVIDATFTFDLEEDKKEELVSWNFIVNYLPEIHNNKKVYESILKMVEIYDEEDLIKALAITINGIEKGKISSNLNTLLNYPRGILERSEDGVEIYDNLAKKYNVDEWIDEIF